MTELPPDAGQLVFQSAIARQKPFTIRDGDTSACPFCDHSLLPPIKKRDGDILLVPNKYPILKSSDPYVLIETADCDSELSLYSENRLYRVFRMGFDFWKEMTSSGAYRSVMFMKNHGPLSGGSLRHPHMQLIGLYNVDCQAHIRREYFFGPVICRAPGLELNLSDHPRVGFAEFNLVLTEDGAFEPFCRLLQETVQYVLRQFHQGGVDSYNLFFYQLEGVTFCKVMPRVVTTPIFIGYSVPQVTDSPEAVVEDMQRYLQPFTDR
ncbi:MAG: DUF4931 domain-containing protein [Clostridiales bacterium]|nr:DUF4931 domain-containing protein [Clostridiales bacterium]